MEETKEEEMPSKKQKIEEKELPPRLSFPRIGKKWGPSYEYPYPEATFKELVCLLKRGGNLDTFLGSEYAICSLIIKAILENKIKQMVIFFPSRYTRSRLVGRLPKAIQCYYHSIGNYVATDENFSEIGGIEINTFNEERLTMKNGFQCEFISCSVERLRGSGGGEVNLIVGDLILFDAKITKKVLMPMIQMSNADTYQLLCIRDDEATAKRGKGLCVGGKSFTLKMDQLSNTVNVCDPTCRSCMVAHETWEQELENQEKAKLKFEKKFESINEKYPGLLDNSSIYKKVTESYKKEEDKQ